MPQEPVDRSGVQIRSTASFHHFFHLPPMGA